MVTEEICDSTFMNAYPNCEDQVGALEAVWWHVHADEVTGQDVIGIAGRNNDEFTQEKNSIARTCKDQSKWNYRNWKGSTWLSVKRRGDGEKMMNDSEKTDAFNVFFASLSSDEQKEEMD